MLINDSNVTICFSNLFKNGASSFSISFSSTNIIHLKLGWTKDNELFDEPNAILAKFFSETTVKFLIK